jgi:undecaprenyl diphosphate synthase
VSRSAVHPVQGQGQTATTARHVAIIMDGNGRWAKARHLPRIAGHKRGAEAVRATVRAAAEMGLEALTLYAFSSENWRRPEDEISDLKGLLRHYLLNELDEIHQNDIRIKIIGDYSRFGQELVTMLEGAIARTAGNRRMTLVIALNYGAQDEIVRAVRKLVAEGGSAQDVTEVAIAARLDTSDLPPLDLLIRTSGERRLSNFLLWQAAYAELLFVDTLWPDFGAAELAEALADFGRRERRYGGL